ncbi:MAG: OmpA family protein [Cytophagaceae bacterium]|nr:OmpA family protein [Cytophagaceae bacterium]
MQAVLNFGPAGCGFWKKSVGLLVLLAVQFSLNALPSLAQLSTNKKAQEFYERAAKLYAERKPAEAMDQYRRAIERDPDFGEAYFQIARLYEADRQPVLAAEWFEKSLKYKPISPVTLPAYGWLGSNALKKGAYANARFFLENMVAKAPGSILARRATRQLETVKFAEEAMKYPLTFRVGRLPEIVNAFDSQYFPVLTADRETLIFTGIATPLGDEDLYLSRRVEELGWTKPVSLSEVINTADNEGTCAISADGRTLVFTVCQGRRRGFGNCDLYVTYQKGDEWSNPDNLGADVNSASWDSQPALSADGRTLYFVSDRPGGLGKRDLWVCRRDSAGHWSKASNLGKALNTPDDDVSPFLHANGRTLFFASEGYVGLGGFDLWMTEQQGNGWSKPENLGYPLNTHEDQVGLFITADGKKGFYSVEESIEKDRRRSKLWACEIPDQLAGRFKKANVLKGRVLDAKTRQPLVAEVELFNLKTNQSESRVTSDPSTGSYTAVLSDGGEYAVTVSRGGYFFKSLSFDYSGKTASEDQQLDLLLEPLRKDTHEVLNNVFFETGKFDLEEKSKPELDKLLRLLKANPKLRLEISGHTDDVGDDKKNLDLSLKRAKSVAEYLIGQGIEQTRLETKGFGKTRPVAPNTSDEARQKNRRIEAKIL